MGGIIPWAIWESQLNINNPASEPASSIPPRFLLHIPTSVLSLASLNNDPWQGNISQQPPIYLNCF